MQRLLIAAVSLSLGLGGLNGGVLAQTNSGLVVIDDASGTDGTNRLSGNCEISGSGRDRLVTCSDLEPGRGTALSDPGTDTAPAPEADSAPETTEMAVATETDRDADNYADALEPEAGLDPTTADTDADHVADGDEFNLYQTDPTIADTDGDGALDGEELFGTHTDPLLWDDGSDTAATSEPVASSDAATEPAPEAAPVEETTTPAETSEPMTTAPATSDKEAAYPAGDTAAPPPEGPTENHSATSTSLLGPDGTYRVTENSPPIVNVPGGTRVEIVPAAAPEPPADTTVDETSESVATDTDGDGVVDTDEVDLYGTAAETWDTDGDGLSDGDELFVSGTDPLLWDTDGDGVADGGVEMAASTELVAEEAAAPEALGLDSDNDRLADADEAAVGTDPATPDADGDGYYDGDEVNLGTDPLDPASFPEASASPESL
jgi:hypothetical protein